ncbi:MAG: hypothetical protein WCX23_00935 [Candidatus Paceibacterota bacterium]|jgi:putative protease|nr:hypothetical protein [Candidatus Paceibacterota bacterium]
MATKKIKPAKKSVKKEIKNPAKKTAKKPVGKTAKPVKKTDKKAIKKTIKKAAKKPVKKPKALAKKPAVKNKKTLISAAKTGKEKNGKQIGKILHYFDKISVAVVELDGGLCVGDMIRVIGGQETDFKQAIKSMELDHKKIKKAKKGQAIGVGLKGKAREGYKVYKI